MTERPTEALEILRESEWPSRTVILAYIVDLEARAEELERALAWWERTHKAWLSNEDVAEYAALSKQEPREPCARCDDDPHWRCMGGSPCGQAAPGYPPCVAAENPCPGVGEAQ